MVVSGAMHPAGLELGAVFSAAKSGLFSKGAEVPEMMSWWAGKLGPWLV
jgi:hypothetical protein